MTHRFISFFWKNLWRSRRRSILTIFGVAVAVFVYAALNAAIEGMTFPMRQVGDAQMLNVREAGRSNVLASRLPATYEERIEDIDGIAAATGVLNELAVVGENRVHIFVRGIDPEAYRAVHAVEVPPGAWEAFTGERHAALVGFRLLARMGWTVGSEVEIELLGLRVHIVGEIPAQGVDLESHMLVHRSYLQVARNAEGEISYVLAAPSPGRPPSQLAAAVDRALAHTAVPTHTASAEGFAEAIVEDFLGFVGYLRVMGLLAVLITTLAAANSIGMSVRERTREIGMLKAIGFPPRLVLTMILVESTALAALGGVVGVGGAALAVGNERASMAGLMLSPTTIALAALLALLIGLAGGLLPAITAARIKTLEALRVVG